MSNDFIAGWAGGVTMTFVGHPCDVWKTHLQAVNRGPKVSALEALFAIVRTQGVAGLVRTFLSHQIFSGQL